MGAKDMTSSKDPTIGGGLQATTIAPPASVVAPAAPAKQHQVVDPGPQRMIRGPDGKFAGRAPEAAPEAPAIRTMPEDSPEVQKARDGLYDTWPEMAIKTWGPRPEKKAAEQAPKTDQPKAQDAPKDVPAAKETVADLARDKAIKALKLDGYTDEDLAALKPERVLALGQAAKARHADVDARLANAGRESKQQTADGAKDGESAQRQLPDELQAAVKELTDEIGSEKAGKALEKILSRYEQREEARVLERIDQELTESRAALRESLPGLSDGEVWEKVVDEMVDLKRTKRYGDAPMRDVMQAAYSNVVPPPTPQQTLVDRLQTDGLATSPPATPPAPQIRGPQKGDDPMRSIFDALREGASVDEAASAGRVALGR